MGWVVEGFWPRFPGLGPHVGEVDQACLVGIVAFAIQTIPLAWQGSKVELFVLLEELTVLPDLPTAPLYLIEGGPLGELETVAL